MIGSLCLNMVQRFPQGSELCPKSLQISRLLISRVLKFERNSVTNPGTIRKNKGNHETAPGKYWKSGFSDFQISWISRIPDFQELPPAPPASLQAARLPSLQACCLQPALTRRNLCHLAQLTCHNISDADKSPKHVQKPNLGG